MEDPNVKTFKVKANCGLKSILENPQREISLIKCTRQDNDSTYWLIQTSLTEYGPEHNQELVISNEALDEVLKLKNIIDKLPPPKYTEVKTTWVNLPDGVSSTPVETFTLSVDVLKDEIPPENIEKNPGYDWVVTYQFEDEPVEEIVVFGAMTVEAALKEAHLSLTASDTPEMESDYAILGVRRVHGV
jgi:hypothetical protein